MTADLKDYQRKKTGEVTFVTEYVWQEQKEPAPPKEPAKEVIIEE